MEDGCGLSRANTVTPFALCALLSEVSKDKSAYKIIENSLPQAGKQGSMSSIGKGTAIEGVLKAKTGYIDRVRAYSGYVTSKKGSTYVFSIIFNHYTCTPREARLKIEKFLVALAEL